MSKNTIYDASLFFIPTFFCAAKITFMKFMYCNVESSAALITWKTMKNGTAVIQLNVTCVTVKPKDVLTKILDFTSCPAVSQSMRCT